MQLNAKAFASALVSATARAVFAAALLARAAAVIFVFVGVRARLRV